MFESELLTQGFSTLLNNPQALLFATFGVMLGIVIGALPGLTATMGVAICCLSPTAWSLFLAC